MSVEANTLLIERAIEMINYWEGTNLAEVLKADIDRNDLDALNLHTSKAEAQASQEEFEAADVY
jgi:hypothetical protein